MRIGFVIIAHEAPDPLIALAHALTSEGDIAVIHYDLRSSNVHFAALQHAFAGNKNVCLAPRVACGWGEYSLVEATLNGLRTLAASGQDFDYIYLLSGADLPLKPIATLRAFLGKHLERKTEFIQSYPMKSQRWIVAGLEKERFIYRHFFNERRHPVFFNNSLRLQRALRLKRRLPAQIDISLGSQWWCLRWDTCLAILAFIKKHPEVDRFFRTVWIPDESYFQSIVRNVVPAERIANYSLTHFQFNDYGKPVVYFDEHFDVLRRQNFFFGRKAASSARNLRQRLLDIGRSGAVEDIDEHQAGKSTMEYDALRSLRREPSALFRSKGRSYSPAASDMPLLPRNVLAVVTTSSAIRLPTGLASPAGTSLVHGDLFGEYRIRFANERPVFGGYREIDTGERDTSPFAFLSNVVAAGPDTTCFCINVSAERRFMVADCLRWLSNSAVLLWAPSSLVDATLAEIDSRLLIYAPSRQLTSSDITNCVSAALLSAQKLRQMSELLSQGATVWFANSGDSVKSLLNPQRELAEVFADSVAFFLESQATWTAVIRTHPLRSMVEDIVLHHGADRLWTATQIRPGERFANSFFSELNPTASRGGVGR